MEEGKKKEGFFKRLGKDLRLQVGFCLVSVLILVIVYLPLSLFIENSVTNEKVLKKSVAEDNNVIADVTEVTASGKKIELFGWAIRLDAEVQSVKAVLNPLDAGEQEEIVLKTSMGQNDAVQNYIEYLQEESVAGSGFKAEVTKEKIQKDVCYEILVYVNYKQKNNQAVKISSQKYLYNEQIYSYNPLEFMVPNFTDEQMAKVVEEGHLLGYTMEHGAWVYRLEDSLYWILDKSVEKNLDDNLYMFFHLNTSRPELLPEARQQYGFDNRDFLFKTSEMEMQGNYRVAKVKLDMGYPITWLNTGIYDGLIDETAWSVRFYGIEQ